jgi:hypothetical protein
MKRDGRSECIGLEEGLKKSLSRLKSPSVDVVVHNVGYVFTQNVGSKSSLIALLPYNT